MTTYDFDLFVIGAGSGGVRAARIAAQHGAKVAIAEEYRFGGTCVIRGCVPKKLLVYASRFRDEITNAKGFGWSLPQDAKFSWPELIAAKDREILRLEGLYRRNLEKACVTIFQDRAEFSDPHTLTLKASGKTVTAAKVLIATGGQPVRIDGLDGVEHTITSDEAFDLKTLPGHIVIAGGGYIGVEFAGIFHGLGAKVTMVNRRAGLLRGFDEDMRTALLDSYRERGIELIEQTTFRSITKSNAGLSVALSNGDTLVADDVMLAVGRAPNTDTLGLDRAGVSVQNTGRIAVDTNQQTNIAHIFAVGDVCDRDDLTPVAIREGQLFADQQFGGTPLDYDFDTIPTAVFSTPEIGTVGLTEDQARQACGHIKVFRSTFRPMKTVLGGEGAITRIKLIVAADSDRVVGCHMFSDHASEMVQAVAIAMRLGATKADFDRTMALHPTAAEELVTLRDYTDVYAEAAE